MSDLRANPNNVSYQDLCNLLRRLGFELKGGKGSHRVFSKVGIREIITLQNVKGKAKAYQVRQVIKIVDKYQLYQEAREYD